MDAPRMRTAKQAAIELHQMDPGTAVTERAIRRMLANKDIPYVAIGNKKLINMDLLLAKLAGNAYNKEAIRVSGKEDETWHP